MEGGQHGSDESRVTCKLSARRCGMVDGCTILHYRSYLPVTLCAGCLQHHRRYVVCFEDEHGARAVRGGGRAPRPALIAIAARGPGPIRGGSPPHCLVRCITVLRSVALNHTLLRTANEADGDKICDTTPGRAKAGCGLCQRPSWHCRRLVEARPGAVPGTNGLEIPWRSDLENLRVALDQPSEGGRANDQCSRNMHPSCRSYRVQERRSMPTRELGFYSCRSGSRTTRPPRSPAIQPRTSFFI